ncbi:MAG: hypothetical protein QME35_02765 [Thermoanaerobacteraceae bacterium]|jgi:hypothetical protein|nr:hypothetical protein [Thermoanaerobacteraceae bacterium]
MDKSSLLKLSKKIGDYFVDNKMTNVLDKIINLGQSAAIAENEEMKKKNKFYRLMWAMNKNPGMLGGGNALRDSFLTFISNYLVLNYRFNNVECRNREFSRLSFDEMMYVFSWAERYLKYAMSVTDYKINNRRVEYQTSGQKHKQNNYKKRK